MTETQRMRLLLILALFAGLFAIVNLLPTWLEWWAYRPPSEIPLPEADLSDFSTLCRALEEECYRSQRSYCEDTMKFNFSYPNLFQDLICTQV
jgi:hypothetical protein